jgi:hypothetical protein
MSQFLAARALASRARAAGVLRQVVAGAARRGGVGRGGTADVLIDSGLSRLLLRRPAVPQQGLAPECTRFIAAASTTTRFAYVKPCVAMQSYLLDGQRAQCALFAASPIGPASDASLQGRKTAAALKRVAAQ